MGYIIKGRYETLSVAENQLHVLAPYVFAKGTIPRHHQSFGRSLGGSDSVVLVANGAWVATANDSWLHLSGANQNGTGSANVTFAFDANSGATRTGTLTIAGQTLSVTQVGST